MEIKLSGRQEEAYEAFKKNNYNGILKVGTGKGKTIFAIYCIKEFLRENNEFRTCVIVPTINLMFQWKKELVKFLEIEEDQISFFYGQEKDSTGKIVIYVVNSAVNDGNLRKTHLLKPFDFMIADECHHYGANLFSKIFDVHTSKALGLSATPERWFDAPLPAEAKVTFPGLAFWGTTMRAWTPKIRAAKATDCPWLPVEAVITPRDRSSGLSWETKLMPPRTLKAPIGW